MILDVGGPFVIGELIFKGYESYENSYCYFSTFPSGPKQWEVKLFGKSVSILFLYEKKSWTLIIKQTKSTFVAYIPRHAKHWWKEIWVHPQLLGHVVDRLVNFERWFKTSETMGSFSAGKTGGFLSLASSCF